MTVVHEFTPETHPDTTHFAGFWIRLFAYLIDATILGIVCFAANGLFGGDVEAFSPAMTAPQKAAALHGLAPRLLLDLAIDATIVAGLLSSSWQATVGERALGIHVVTSSGGRVTFFRGVLRYLCSLVSSLTFGIGFFMIGWTRENTALHDLMVDTRVVYGRLEPAEPARP